jgi:prepilin peptidase CpaA
MGIHPFFIGAGLVAAVAAVFDWKTGEIPNWLTLPVLLIAPFAHAARQAAARQPGEEALWEAGYSLGGALVCAIVPMILYRQSAIGGGDVKLLAALGAILQPTLGVEAQMYAFFAATVLAPARLAYEGKLLSTLKNSFTLGMNWFVPKSRQASVDATTMSWFRLGPAIFFGVVFTVYLHWN